MNHKIASLIMATTIAASCTTSNNPLTQMPYDTPHNVPPFGQFNNADFIPAFQEEIRRSNETVELITSQREAPTFTNTIIPFDQRNKRLDILSCILMNLRESDSNDSINQITEEVMPMLTEMSDNVYMNAELFARIKTVYDNRSTANLDSSQLRVVELYYSDFVRNGALLSEKDQAKLREMNQQLSLLSLKFSDNLLKETNAFSLVIDTVVDLKGLPENIVTAAAEKAASQGLEGKWVFTLQKASMIPFLRYCENHELREKIYTAYCTRGDNDNENDNKEVVQQILNLRAKKAKLLGYKTYAHYVLEENMVGTPEVADSFMNQMWEPALRRARQEYQDLRNYAFRYNYTTQIDACDWWYWAEKLRKAKYDIDETELSQYLSIDNAVGALFDVANKLYGISFKQADNIPLYNEADNVVYEVFDKDQSYLGLIYFDFYPRASKGAGAWCTVFQDALDNFDGTRQTPNVSIVSNITAPTADAPALLNFDDVETLFHEFGHALHSFFTHGKYRRTAGYVPRDYVEMPSQFMEHFASEPQVLRSYAKHYQTGEVIPDALIKRIGDAATFNQGFMTVELLAAAKLDLAMHTIEPDTLIDVRQFEAQVLKDINMPKEIVPRYRTTYFAHSFNFDYAAAYNAYLWAQMLDCDAFAAFAESDSLFNQSLAESFRQNCLAEAGDKDPMQQYINFRHKKPSIEPLLKQRGLVGNR